MTNRRRGLSSQRSPLDLDIGPDIFNARYVLLNFPLRQDGANPAEDRIYGSGQRGRLLPGMQVFFRFGELFVWRGESLWFAIFQRMIARYCPPAPVYFRQLRRKYVLVEF